MKTAVMYIGMAALVYLAAQLLKEQKDKFAWIGRILTFIVFSLVTCMGFKIGSNKSAINDIGTIGLYSLIISVTSLAATIVALHLIRKAMKFDAYGNKKIAIEAAYLEKKTQSDKGKVKEPMIGRTTLLYMCGVITGFGFGYFAVIKFGFIDYETGYMASSIYITTALYIMVLLVGVDMGLEGNMGKVFKETGIKVLAFPLVTAISTLAAVFLCALFMPYTFQEMLAIGCTFCWYSLAPNIIIDAGFVSAGAVAFLANFSRVILSLLLIPTVARKIGYVETIGMPAAASMDVCIATIEKSTNKRTALYAFASGAVFTVLIPIIVPMIVGV